MNIAPTAALAAVLATCLCGCQQRPDAADPDREAASTIDTDDGEAIAPPSDAPASRSFRCDEILVASRIDTDGGPLALSLSGRRLVLAPEESASGTAYADEQGNRFRFDGDTATLTLHGDPPRTCMPTTQVSPWDAAAARGVRFRAIGQEPGWLLEVGGGDRPTLTAQLDYGERFIEVENAEPRADDDGFEGTATDGTVVRLDIEREACADPMSGEPFEASVRLQVGKRTYAGCGAFLDD
ncbi:MliC family protein [Luteimonas salinilitoris]|uniref:MliC family protein n=1 Tax=Luteimonas salinilitoris TaxID=3237697 RepID=A0ABV4HQC4_9GAMM